LSALTDDSAAAGIILTSEAVGSHRLWPLLR
jgi:hypothetical protein